ncbi:MAG TPA: protein kinase [Gemmatimonadales bacterium]|nr:protein kinase [Gemmatimonadales bacterium]
MPTDLRSDLQATLGSGFRVTRELAGGGMSRVFVAEEELLQREIVVKLLPPDLMAGLSVQRFQAEIQHAARLQHPHIVPVLSAGIVEYEGGTRGPFYTMPYIRGQTLRARLERDGALPPDEVRRILLDIVDALTHAHDAGIVHRDIKPDNVFLVGRNALVTDFGVSKALMPTPGAVQVTGVGVALGTPGYMAPEQAAADSSLDHRADIYAIGVLAYELLSGRRPFEGSSIQELLVAQAVATPVPLLELRPAVQPELVAIVMRCLEKRPQDRFGTAHELQAALEALPSGTHSNAGIPVPIATTRRPLLGWAAAVVLAAALLLATGWALRRRSAGVAAAAGTIHDASVAVLPPEYFRPDSAVAATLADLVDRISNDLSRIEGLRVVNYMSVGALLRRGSTPTLKDLGTALGVEHFVLFVPRRTGRGAEVAVQLVEAPTQAQLWVTSYAPDAANVGQIEEDVVSRVTHAILGPTARLPLQAHAARARSEGAHEQYLAGQLALRRRTAEGIAEAIRYFEEAVRLDSTHAQAVGRLATALALQLSYGYRTTIPSYPTAARALSLAERAMILDPSRGEPVAFRAYIEYLAFAPLSRVRADFDRAVALHPAEADVAGWNALVLLREGRIERSLAEARRALELDPVSSARHLTLALAALGARRYDLAAVEAHRASETEPGLRRPRQVEALALLLQNRGGECAAMDLWPHQGVKAMCLSAAGREAEARALVDSLRRAAAGPDQAGPGYSDAVPVQELAIYYGWTANGPEALRYLRLAFERSPVGVDQRIVQSGVFDRIRRVTGFGRELEDLQNAVWPRVLEQRRRLDAAAGTTPFGFRSDSERPVG